MKLAQFFCRERLSLEQLERRDLLSVTRLAAWNTLNNPNDAGSAADFSTVLAAIGNATVEGNTKRIDILALQETDPPGAGSNSITRIEDVLDNLYPSTDYASVVSAIDGGGDSTGFVYDTSAVSLLEAQEIEPAALTHTVLRGKFRPDATLGESDFYVYSVHLKSGNSAADATQRGIEANLLRADADRLGAGAHVLFVGDFNMQGSTEVAAANFAAAGAGQVQDVAAAPGQWHDNPAFLSLHTQNPQLSVDDRFDLQYASGEFFDGTGLEYVDNSFHVFGNNGTHALNGPITTGSGADPAVLAALVAASDHLPIVADYELIPSTPQVRIRETAGSTEAIEGGIFDTYSVVLDTVPTANVTVTLSPDSQIDLGSGPGVAVPLVFTPTNALTPQFVVTQAADDAVGEGTHAGLVSHTSLSSDSDYDGLTIADVTVQVIDNDTPTIVINELDADTESIDMLEFVELYDGGVGHTSLTGQTLVFFNGNGDTAYETFDLAGHTTDADGFFVLGNSALAATDLTFANNSLQNGADAVALYAGSFALGGAVTTANLLDAVVYDTNDADDAGLLALLTAGQPQLNEDQQSNRIFDSLARLPDSGTPRRTETYTAQAPTPAARNAPLVAGATVTQSANRIDVEEGGMVDSYQLALNTFPSQDVIVTVDPDDQTDLGAGAGVAITLTFTAANAILPQTIQVIAAQDLLAEGQHTSLITHTISTADSAYASVVVDSVVANVTDTTVAEPPSIVISEIMYNPDSDESEPGVAEWIEVVNTGTSTVDLGGWLFDDEDATNWGAIPAQTDLAPGQVAVFFDDEFTTAATFRSAWSISSEALVVGITWGSLANTPSATSEILELLDNSNTQMDLVNFDDSGVWPADGAGGASIYLTDLAADNNDGNNWALSTLGVEHALSPAGPTFATTDVGSPGRVVLPVVESADFDTDRNIDGHDFLLWQRGFGTVAPHAVRADGDADSDTDVDAVDLAIWELQYGSSAQLSAQATTSNIARQAGTDQREATENLASLAASLAGQRTKILPQNASLDDIPTAYDLESVWLPESVPIKLLRTQAKATHAEDLPQGERQEINRGDTDHLFEQWDAALGSNDSDRVT